MKKIFLATTAIVALAGGAASAADMPMKAPPPRAVAACAQFGGFYIGGNAGGAYYEHNYNDRDGWAGAAANELPNTVRLDNSGFIGGVQGGYNWQWGCTVFGIAADYSWTSINNNSLNTDGQQGIALDSVVVNSRLRNVGTVRTRTGVVVDNLLLYVTGGFAWANVDRSHTLTDFIGAAFVSETFSSSKQKWGWTLGFGTEWAAWGNWTINSEVLYARFKSDTAVFNGFLESNPVVLQKLFDYSDNVWITRIGLNYRFNWVN
jgi:outer membrane immunogenic protein